MTWRFYVYEIIHEDECLYVGKGSGDRLRAQERSFWCKGREIARFKLERECYAFERQLIADRKPWLNVAPGGNGSRSTPKPAPRKAKWQRDMEAEYRAVGGRCMSARILLRYRPLLPQFGITNIAEIERIANSPGIR
jgi:hypothetical protein